VSSLCERMPGNLLHAGGDIGWILVTKVGDHGLPEGVRINTKKSLLGKVVFEADPNSAAFKALEASPPRFTGLVDNNLFGTIIYKGGTALFILGRIEDGRHAGVLLDADESPVNGRLVAVDPNNEAYRSCVATLSRVMSSLPASWRSTESS